MRTRVTFLVALMLTAPLSGCAPALTAQPSGSATSQVPFATDIYSRAAAIDLLEVRPDTAAKQLVRLPDCELVAYWEDIQRVGVGQAQQQCLELDKGVKTFAGVLQISMFILALPAIYFLFMVLNIFSTLGG